MQLYLTVFVFCCIVHIMDSVWIGVHDQYT